MSALAVARADEVASLTAIVERFIGEGYSVAAVDRADAVPKGEKAQLELELKVGSEYLFIGVCGGSCTHLELVFRDGKGAEIARTPEKEAAVALAGAPPSDGAYNLLLEPRTCENDTCPIAYAVLEKAPEPAAPATDLATAAPSDANASPALPPTGQPNHVQPGSQIATGTPPAMSATLPPALPTIPQSAPALPAPEATADALAESLIIQLKALILSKIEIEQALAVEPPALMPPAVTDEQTAPGKAKSPPASPSPASAQPSPSTPRSAPKTPQPAQANCAQMAARIRAVADTAGDLASIENLKRMHAEYYRAGCRNPG